MTKVVAAIAAILASTAATAAQAQSFTFESKNEAPTWIGAVSPEGVPFGSSTQKGTGATIFADGRKASYSFTCVQMNQPEHDSIFNSHMVCDVAASDGNFAVIGGCNFLDKERTKNSCVAGLYGKSGAYQGKRGNLATQGGSTSANGVGQWFR